MSAVFKFDYLYAEIYQLFSVLPNANGKIANITHAGNPVKAFSATDYMFYRYVKMYLIVLEQVNLNLVIIFATKHFALLLFFPR
jgi:hypothetical protein